MPTTPRLRSAAVFAMLVLIAIPAVADWDEGGPHKMHYPQLPNPNGWDVAATFPFTMVGDDWQCSRTGPVTEIHLWGSWMGDVEVPIVRFHLEIWSDQPATDNEHSRPLLLLWENDFLGPDGWVERPWGQGDQGWFNPLIPFHVRPDHMGIWQYNFAIDPTEAFIQERGTIYWLVVWVELAVPVDPMSPPNWGWKTSLEHWNDDSVWAEIQPAPQWFELFDPETGVSLDQAFVVNGPEGPDLYDWGDAPDQPYPTLFVSNGAHHSIAGLNMGVLIDDEPNGQPDPNALGDDLNGTAPDDEDGVTFQGALLPGAAAQVAVVANGPGLLDAWIDYNGNGVWDHPAEHLDPSGTGMSIPVFLGVNTLTIAVPASAVLGPTFARFRISHWGGLPPTGFAPAGEVEDYEVTIGEADMLDFGDAPDQPYPTLLASGGANHIIGGNIFMGASIDPEPDGQPDPTATGDDNDGNDDEDGVAFTTPLFSGANAQVTVVTTTGGLLDAWIDFNGNGGWEHPTEHLWGGMSLAVAPGPNNLTFAVPAGAALGQTFARFRISSAGGLAPTGGALDGEVEDYEVLIEEDVLLDFGDAPDQPYPTLLVSTGARHIIDGVTFMGGPPDAEPDGQPNGNATGDDSSGAPDEDGVIFLTPFVPGFSAHIDVIASAPGFLDAWIDFDGNGNWVDPYDQIFMAFPLNPGSNILIFPVPSGLSAAGTFARFRFSLAGGLAPGGLATTGEVEDYEILIEDPIYDWGDAPDQPYPTLAASSGAVHTLAETVYLGTAAADGETDGQPDPIAAGDDLLDGNDDEEGVRHIPDSLEPTGTVTVLVTASTAGFLNGWVDFDNNGSWLDSGEQVFTNQALVAGLNTLSFVAPAGSVTPTFTRYRFDTGGGGLGVTGPAADGEVEDHYLRDREIFSDGFESGDTSGWDSTTP